MGRPIARHIPDLRYDYDEKGDVSSQDDLAVGTYYRKGRILQVWWESDVLGRRFDPPKKGRETWFFPDLEQAKESFQENVFGDDNDLR